MHNAFLELVDFFYTELPPAYETPRHCHHFCQLDVVLEGQRQIVLEDNAAVGDEVGDAWLIPPLVRHAYASSTGYRHMLFHFHIAPRFWSLLGRGFVKFRVSDRLREDIENAGSRAARGAALAHEQVSAVASLCLVEYLDQSAAAPPPLDNLDEFRQVLWPLLERVDREPYAGWTVARMAAECHLSPDYFSRCFLRVFHWAPHQYILEMRMRAVSAELLAAPDRPLKEIADRAGYGTVQAFGRAFKRVFNMSPGAYRNAPHDN